MTDRQYVYRITEVVKVTDGDTYWLKVDVGFRMEALINVRLLGFDCPERNKGSEFERARGKVATTLTWSWLSTREVTYWVRTEKDPDDFGRWLGEIWFEDGTTTVHLGDHLRNYRLASVWPTRWRDEFERTT
jgi:endonuclease YncB( thermonuclease family)